MNRLLILWLLMLALSQSCTSFGQELTLHDVLTITRQVNPKLQSLDHLVKARQGAMQQADVALNPRIGLNAGNRVQVLKIGQELEYSGKRAARTQVALAEVEVAKSELDLVVLELQQEVTKLFYDLLWAQKNVELLQNNLQITEKFLEAATYKFNQGFGNKLDVVKGQVEVARAKRLLKSTEQTLVVGQNRMKILLKMPSNNALLLKGDLFQTVFHFAKNLDSLLLVAAQHHPALLAEKHRLKAAEYQVVVAQLSSKPNFDFELAGGVDQKEPTAELSINVPLALWDTKKGAKAEAQFQQKSQEYSVEEARNNITQQVMAAYFDYQTATASARLFEETLLREAKEAAANAQTAFETGGFRFLDLIDAQRTYLEAGLEYYESLRALRQAEIDLQAAVGISTF